jgi:L-seryl-tRNA(Ser) seleniumtransferase
MEKIASAGIACQPTRARGGGNALIDLAAAFRNLPVPIIGRIEKHALIFDLRCLEDEAGFARNLAAMTPTAK